MSLPLRPAQHLLLLSRPQMHLGVCDSNLFYYIYHHVLVIVAGMITTILLDVLLHRCVCQFNVAGFRSFRKSERHSMLGRIANVDLCRAERHLRASSHPFFLCQQRALGELHPA